MRGTLVEVDVGAVAHGGHCVARHEGRVVFVRHALPGERVRAKITEGGEESRFLRADAVDILVPSADRVEPPCPYARPELCGGCDFQHVDLAAQRKLLGQVVSEQLQRLAGLDREVTVEPVPGDANGLGWRTRVRFAVDADGRPGLRRHRSHEIIRIDGCLIAHPDLPSVTEHQWPGVDAVEAVVAGSGETLLVVEPTQSRRPVRLSRDATTSTRASAPNVVLGSGERLHGRTWLVEPALGRDWRVSGAGFWQVHPGAAETLVNTVLAYLQPTPGESALDLYAGVGLFAGALAASVGATGSVIAVESDATAVRNERRNLHDLPQVQITPGRAEHVLRGSDQVPAAVDLVVLDPPRVGARRPVVEAICARSPRAVAYVACDPAALARDIAIFAEHGYQLAALTAYDIFPMTHHVECVALLTRS